MSRRPCSSRTCGRRSRIVGLRHRIVHDYFAIDLGIGWEVVTRDLPGFEERLRHLRERPGRGG